MAFLSTIQSPGGPMKTWKRDLLDHLVFLVLRNAESPPSEDEVRDELKREFHLDLSDDEPVRPSAA